TLIDDLKESRVMALGNIKRSQEKQKFVHDERHTLRSFTIGDK
ncbi:5422_t:CDS:1, partial [Dentiscutata heterogama]